jgi:flagellin-like protein
MNHYSHEEGISPIIGAILLVALTVIMAGIIAVFVLGMTGELGTMKAVTVKASQSGPYITITYMGGPAHEEVTQIKAEIYKPGHSSPSFTIMNNNTAVGYSATTPAGYFVPEDENRVVVIARFDDGTEQVVLDTYV